MGNDKDLFQLVKEELEAFKSKYFILPKGDVRTDVIKNEKGEKTIEKGKTISYINEKSAESEDYTFEIKKKLEWTREKYAFLENVAKSYNLELEIPAKTDEDKTNGKPFNIVRLKDKEKCISEISVRFLGFSNMFDLKIYHTFFFIKKDFPGVENLTYKIFDNVLEVKV